MGADLHMSPPPPTQYALLECTGCITIRGALYRYQPDPIERDSDANWVRALEFTYTELTGARRLAECLLMSQGEADSLPMKFSVRDMREILNPTPPRRDDEAQRDREMVQRLADKLGVEIEFPGDDEEYDE